MPGRFLRPTLNLNRDQLVRLSVKELRPINAQSFRLTIDKTEISAARIVGLRRDAGDGELEQAPLVTIVRPLDHRQLFYAWRRKVAQGHQDRRVVRVHLYDGPALAERLRHTFVLKGAAPVNWSGPDLDANSDALAEERVEISYSTLLWIPANPDTA